MLDIHQKSNNLSTLWVLITLCILLAYISFGKHTANQKLLKISEDQHQTIEDLKKSVIMQNFYIQQLENYYYSAYNYTGNLK